VLCQWVPLDLDQESLPRMMLQTLRAEFPHVSLWIPNRMEGVALASDEPLALDLERLRRRMADPALHADMAAYGLGEPEQLAATFVAADEALAGFIGPAPLVTDNRPRLEYFDSYPWKRLHFTDILPHREPVEKYLTAPPSDPARLKAAEEVITHIWYNHEKTEDRQLGEARVHVEQALRLDSDNRYLLYLRSQAGE
jgi:spermidine synthase